MASCDPKNSKKYVLGLKLLYIFAFKAKLYHMTSLPEIRIVRGLQISMCSGWVSSTGGREGKRDLSQGDNIELRATTMDRECGRINFCAEYVPTM